jgi:hypothetical protein
VNEIEFREKMILDCAKNLKRVSGGPTANTLDALVNLEISAEFPLNRIECLRSFILEVINKSMEKELTVAEINDSLYSIWKKTDSNLIRRRKGP